MMMIRTSMGINVQKPCVVYEDNRTAIKIGNNATVMKLTNHIDIHHHFLCEHADNGTINDQDPPCLDERTARRRHDESTRKSNFPSLP